MNLQQKENNVVVPVCAAIESELSELEDDEREEFQADMGIDEPGLNRVIRAGYELLRTAHLLHGVKEVRALDNSNWCNSAKSSWQNSH